MWCGTAYHFNKALENVRFEDYDFTYVNPLSRFSYLGTGQAWEEVNVGPDCYFIWLDKRKDMTKNHPALKNNPEVAAQ